MAPSPDLPRIGLCATCRHSRVIATSRGGAFRLCERSRTDRRYPRYPALPVLRCAGFEPVTEGQGVDVVVRRHPYSP